MKKFKGTITSDFKNSNKKTTFDCEMYAARYNNGNYFKLFFDRSDERRQVLTMQGDEMANLLKGLNSLFAKDAPEKDKTREALSDLVRFLKGELVGVSMGEVLEQAENVIKAVENE